MHKQAMDIALARDDGAQGAGPAWWWWAMSLACLDTASGARCAVEFRARVRACVDTSKNIVYHDRLGTSVR
eukprot:COSAG06_NODE_1434_length_9475_cov_4.461071_1_plen_71_part_00